MIILMVVKKMIILSVELETTLIGGPGQDKFICGQGNDFVLDFNATEGDIRSNDCEAVAAAP
jgi:hypothetical protein